MRQQRPTFRRKVVILAPHVTGDGVPSNVRAAQAQTQASSHASRAHGEGNEWS
jgi:uncharacterized protein (UPF0147 family)